MKILTLLPLAISLSLTACGGSGTEKDKKTDTATKKEQKVTLSTLPINLDAALYSGPAEYTKIEPCPFLSDETAAGTYKLVFGLKGDKQERLSVSNTECRWSYFDVRIPSEKNSTYRLNQIKKYDGAQALKLQDGPGKAAFIYYSKLRNPKKQTKPSGFIFSQNDKTIFISGTTSAEATSIKKLREVADEVARLLPHAPKIKEQSKKLIVHFNVCDIWDKKNLENLFGTDQVLPSLSSGGPTCKYGFTVKSPKSGNLAIFDLIFNFGSNNGERDVCDSSLEKGAKLEKNFSHKVISKTYKAPTTTNTYNPSSEELTTCFNNGTFYIYISGPDLRYSKQMRLLIKNILSRLPK